MSRPRRPLPKEPDPIRIRPVEARDAAQWLGLRARLWPDGSAEEHEGEIEAFLRGGSPLLEPAVLVAVDPADRLVGFAELSVRACAEGCSSSRIAYLEGWFVVEERRGRGVGHALIRAAETWARERGCEEFASDTDPENSVGQAAHEAVGFEDVGLVRCYRKRIEPGGDAGR